jgi:Pyruvate/2-oxoacid:ferredoxin oxidoreductase delta subunit
MNSASPNLRKKIDELSKISYIATTIIENCKSCGTCVKFCPLNVREFNKEGIAITVKGNFSCGGCSVCYMRCPNDAILLKIQKRKV